MTTTIETLAGRAAIILDRACAAQDAADDAGRSIEDPDARDLFQQFEGMTGGIAALRAENLLDAAIQLRLIVNEVRANMGPEEDADALSRIKRLALSALPVIEAAAGIDRAAFAGGWFTGDEAGEVTCDPGTPS